MKAVEIIKSSLEDLDKVGSFPGPIWQHACLLTAIPCLAGSQLEDIPGEVESEKGHQDTITN